MDNRLLSTFKDLYNIIKHKQFVIPAVVICLVAVTAIFIGPKITGFTLFSNNLEECKTDLEICGTNVDTLTEKNIQLEADLATTRNTIIEKESEIVRAQEEYENEITAANEKYDELSNTFNVIVDNAAINKCCKEYVDDNTINSFNILNDKIDCVEGGTFKIDCS
jgi:hypothetical protein